MKMSNNIYWLAVIAVVFCVSITGVGDARADQLGGLPGDFMRMGLGADRVAMGDCGVASVQSGAGWYYNPASLPYLQRPIASIGYRWMSLDRSIMYAGISLPVKPNAGLAFGVLRSGVDNIDGRDSNGEHFDMLSFSNNLIHGSFALMPHKRVGIGISIKWMISAVPDILDDDKNLYAYGIGIDLGMRVRVLSNFNLGLQLRELNAKYSWESSEVWGDDTSAKEDTFPMIVRLGGEWEPLHDLTLVAELLVNSQDIGDDSEAFDPHFGAEWRYPVDNDKKLKLRAGYNGDTITFGMGLQFDVSGVRANFNYAFLIEPVAPGSSHMVSWVFEI